MPFMIGAPGAVSRSRSSVCAYQATGTTPFRHSAAARKLNPEQAGGVADVLEAIRLFLDRPEQLGSTEEELSAEVRSLFDHQEKLGRYHGPLLVLHAREDALLDRSHAERLHAWGGGRDRRLVLFPAGDHNSILLVNHEQYAQELQDFLQRAAVSD
jgi:pimeloyl-ACP methyl ester carboxylesterase